MHIDLKWIVHITQSEYKGGSFNGPNLIKTLKSLTLDQVKSTETFESHTVWGIVLHLMKWKHYLAVQLGDNTLSPFPYEGDNFPKLPDTLTAAAWETTLAEMDTIHAAYMKALSELDASKLDEAMTWGCSVGEAIAWMTTHDTYHIAQIRNMGLEINIP